MMLCIVSPTMNGSAEIRPWWSDNGGVQQRLGRVVTADGTVVAFASVGAGRPLVYVMGVSRENEQVSFPVEGVDGGSVSMLTVQFG